MPKVKTRAAERYVALLRGINLGKRQVAMPALVEVFESAGCHDVRTYIQSGNVVFAAARKPDAPFAKALEAAMAKRFGFEVPVVVRSRAELRGIVDEIPYPDPATVYVLFLQEKPGAKQLAGLDPDRSPPDSFRVAGKDIYLNLPHGVAKTKLNNAYFDRALGTVATFRNWRTVLTLLEMTGELG